jgi:hypothetical protein
MARYQSARWVTIAAIVILIAAFLIFGDSVQGEFWHETIETIGPGVILVGSVAGLGRFFIGGPASYGGYLAAVPQFFSNHWIYQERAEVTFLPKILSRTLLDGLEFFVSIPFLELVEAGQRGVIPVMLHIM